MATPVINLVTLPRAMDRSEAFDIAFNAGVTLLTEDTPVSQRWDDILGDGVGSVWVGATKYFDDGQAVRWVWIENGQTIDPAKFDPSQTNADDDISNDTPYVALLNSQLTYVPEGSVRSALMAHYGSSIKGTPYSDLFFLGGAAYGTTIRLGNGDDGYDDSRLGYNALPSGGSVFGDAGDDEIIVTGQGITNVSDGQGQDKVWLQNGVLKAAMDGANDSYFVLFGFSGRLSYGDARLDIVASGYHARSAEIGDDLAYGPEFVSGAGNDTISGYERIQGGAGDDVLTPLFYAEGGQGDDTLVATALAPVADPTPFDGLHYTSKGPANLSVLDLRGGEGQDTLIFYRDAKASGGAGDDLFVFKTAAFVQVSDLSGGDRIDLSALLPAGALGLASVADAYAQGYLKQSYKSGYTHLWFDSTGGADQFIEIAAFKGSVSHLAAYLSLESLQPAGLTLQVGAGGVAVGAGGDDQIIATAAPLLVQGGGGHDQLSVASSMIFSAGSIEGIEQVQVQSGAMVDFSSLSNGLVIGAEPPSLFGVNIVATQGDDLVTGSDLADRLDGAGGYDHLLGGAGDDILMAGAGFARLFGQQGDDVLQKMGPGLGLFDGGEGVDTLIVDLSALTREVFIDLTDPSGQHDFGKDGSMIDIERLHLTGSQARDVLIGGELDDWIDGGGFADTLIGAGGNDVLIGGQGEDHLMGGLGDDVLTGGLGAQDTFILSGQNFGSDRITDFELGVDKIDLSWYFENSRGWTILDREINGNTILDFIDGQPGYGNLGQLVLEGVTGFVRFYDFAPLPWDL